MRGDDKIYACLFDYVGPGTAGPARSSGAGDSRDHFAALKSLPGNVQQMYLAIDSCRSDRRAPVLPRELYLIRSAIDWGPTAVVSVTHIANHRNDPHSSTTNTSAGLSAREGTKTPPCVSGAGR